ncbi:hypothetical protein PR048_006835 [Dryococelus australis]|uniref:Uncharacterized protein n=1 Tax=Dryococelus australis TaxID=614101 RepID=A0ABQ9IC34_9NEOP|nr:hypothetical protein PR048_006835 [Dryococelus australis]
MYEDIVDDKEEKQFLKMKMVIIVQCLSDKYLDLVKDARRTKYMLKSLKEVFERKTAFSKLYLKKKLLALKFKPKEKLEDHFLRFDGLVRDLENAGAKMDDTDKICHLLLTMGDKFNTVITAIETMKQDLTMEFFKVWASGRGNEMRRNLGEIITTSETSLWHRRLGHLNRRGLLVLNLLFIEEKCPQCLEGKAKRLPFKKNEKSTESIGELLHSDLCGPLKTATREAEQYLMNFIKMVKTQHVVKRKIIKPDNGAEFKTLKAERMNLTLMNKVRTKFAETDLPHTFWGEAVSASAYEQNRSPTSGGYRLWDPLKDKIVSSRDVIFKESKVGVGNDMARYQGINVEEENEHLNRKDSTEAKTDTEENGTKEVTKHGTPQQSSEESHEEFIDFEDPDKEKNKRNKPNRTVKKPSHLQEYELYMSYCLCAGEPQDYEDAIKLGNGWEEAIKSEIKALELHQTWTPTVLPPGETVIETKWIFKTKKDGLKKARLVAKGQLDIPTAFLNGYVDDDIYIKTPDGVKNEPGKVLKLERSLYGLCSAPRKWNERFHNFMETHVINGSASDFFLYIGEFKAKDMGILSECLGTMIINDGNEVKLSQNSFINKILSEFNMILYKGVNTPMVCDFEDDTEEPVNEKFMFWQLISSLIYVATVSRPVIYSVCYLSRFLNKPTGQLWKAGKRVLRYLQQIQDLCLTLKPSSDDKLVCYSDSDWAGDKFDGKSVSGCVLLHSKNTTSWASIKQGTVALSIAEAEYIACATAVCDLVYLQGVLYDLQSATSTPVFLTDNQSDIDMAESFENSRRSRHMDIKFR